MKIIILKNSNIDIHENEISKIRAVDVKSIELLDNKLDNNNDSKMRVVQIDNQNIVIIDTS